ncbi:MAG: flavodoxin family protein [Eubacterium sp.]|nr:flavodoxin family protein [Eubacterium sp.]
MKITAIMGSHRNGGHTAKVLAHFLEMIEDKSELRVVNVNKDQIKPCLACDYCLDHQGQCVITDDAMTGIYADIFASELLIVASPVYFTAFPSKIKALFDRTQMAFNLKDRSGIVPKQMIFIGVGGAPAYPHQFDGMGYTLKWYNRYLKVAQMHQVTFVHTDVTPALDQKEGMKALEELAQRVNAGRL